MGARFVGPLKGADHKNENRRLLRHATQLSTQ